MALPPEALNLIKSFEGYLREIGDGRVKPYLCPANVPTIGWGTTRYPDGRRVTMADAVIDRDTATKYLAHELMEDEAAVDRASPGVKWTPLMRGAIVSFAYNCGSGAYRASTLRRKILAGQWQDVPRELAKWNKGGGRVLPGLVRRRKAEADLFMRGVSLMGKVPPADVAPPIAAPNSPPAAPRRESAALRLLRWILRK